MHKHAQYMLEIRMQKSYNEPVKKKSYTIQKRIRTLLMDSKK